MLRDKAGMAKEGVEFWCTDVDEVVSPLLISLSWVRADQVFTRTAVSRIHTGSDRVSTATPMLSYVPRLYSIA